MRLLAFFNSTKKPVTEGLDTNDQFVSFLVAVLWNHVPFPIS